jgi:hypothetical protein
MILTLALRSSARGRPRPNTLSRRLEALESPEAAFDDPLLAGIPGRTHARTASANWSEPAQTDAKAAAFAFGRARGVVEARLVALAG